MKTYIIHVSDHLQREKHIRQQVEGRDLSVSFVNEGDLSDLSKDKLDAYFSDEMHRISEATSCAYKHLLAMERIVSEKHEYALILEDDIIFYPHADKLLADIKAEIAQYGIQNCIISLEDSTLQYIKRSVRVADRHLYPETHLRLAGAYIIDRLAAEHILNTVKIDKCNIPIDWYLSNCSQKSIVDVYWSHPTVAVQGSLLGNFKSLIDDKPSGIFRIISFKVQRLYKNILYNLR